MEQQDGQPVPRRLVGIDLGIASRHSVRVLEADGAGGVPVVVRADGGVAGRRWSGPRWPGRRRARGWRWCSSRPGRRGCRSRCSSPAAATRVYRVSSAKAADLRRFLRRHAKSNGIDAETLARMPLADPGGLQPLELPGPDAAALDRRVRACDRLTRAASEHKVRIKDLVRQLMPMTPLTGDLGKADLAVLERYADPRALLAAGDGRADPPDRHGLGQPAGHRSGPASGGPPPRPPSSSTATTRPCRSTELAAEVATEVRLLRAIQAELAAHAAAREQHYRQVDPGQLARSLPGFAEISAPVLVAAMGRPGRFRDGTRFKSYAGLAPRASETGDTDRKGQPMSKAGPSLLRATLVPRRRHRPPAGPAARPDLLPADDRARRHPPQGLLRRRRPPRRTGLDRAATAAPPT